ncbi:nucleotide diphosphatase/phosphodiesterase [Saccharomycopsis crataegensis]|uniref:Nucleotide diphosphatase/phosphodiesterase n=1 Tax=Saccharomycopsis crataegensis TaxID=43959 RepID=A0AAV5QN86_9ASCO|nr:nucleotide diphosphatase/phosphodiesterase [Saccharomycopsis crataegensis]
MNTPHDIDIPITDLDDSDEDDIIIHQPVANSLIIENDDDHFGTKPHSSFFKRLISPLRLNYSELNLQRESIELADYNVDIGQRIKNPHFLDSSPKSSSWIKRMFFHITIFGFMGSLLLSSIAISNHKQDQLKSHLFDTEKPIYNNGSHDFYPTTIMISLDGFHPHYISPQLTPFMHNLYIDSYGPPYMVPSFPSSTFPNHWTMATGLLPAWHGIVGNTFYDLVIEKQFINVDGGSSLDKYWWGGEPIWETAFYHGVSTAVHMWPGSEVPIDLGRPLEFDKYNGSELLSKKVDRLIDWIDRDISSRPELILGYVPTIDSIGHKYGVSGKQLENGLKYVDNFVETVILELQSRNLSDIVNLIIVSDHGMAPTSDDRLIMIDNLIDLGKIQHFDGWPLFGLRPFEENSVEEVYEDLERQYNELSSPPHFQIFRKEDMPEEWLFGNVDSPYDDRIAPIWLVPDVGYAIVMEKEVADNGGTYKTKGIHGYNNTEVLMRALFLGTGPYFDSKVEKYGKNKVEPFRNTEIYNIVCDSLHFKPNENNGTTNPELVFQKILEDEWNDPVDYPNVDFEIEIIVDANATYDLLFRSDGNISEKEVDIPLNPTSSLLSTEEVIGTSITPESVPGPTFKPDHFETITVTKETTTSSTNTVETSNSVETSTSETSSTDSVQEHDNSLWNYLEDKIEGIIEEIGDEAKVIFDQINDAVSKDDRN